MRKKPPTQRQLLSENEDLRGRLEKAEGTLREILSGEADALFVQGMGGKQVFTLKGADQSYRTLIESMSEGALTVTAEGMIVYANRRFAEMLGTPLAKVIGSEIHTWFAPESRQVLQTLLRKDAVGNRREELALAAADGIQVPVYLSVNRLVLNEVPDSFCMIATDLTEQKHNEALLAGEKLARAILEQAADAIVICDETGRIIRASKQAQAFYDENLLGQLFEHAFPLRQLDGTAFSPLGAIDSSPRQSVESRLECNGKEFNLLVSVGHLKGARSELLGSVVTLTDFTERKRTAERLRVSEWRFRQMAENIRDVFFLIDSDSNRMLYISPAYEEIWGRTCESLYASPESWTDAILPDDRASTYEKYQKGMSAGKFEFEYRIVRPDGSIRWIEARGFPVRDDAGKVVRIAGVAADITGRKNTEMAMGERMRVAEFAAEISGALATEADLRAMLQKCAEAAVQHLEAAFARIWTLNERENILELQASAGMYTHIDCGHGRVPVGRFEIGLIAQERRPHLTNAVVGDPRVSDQEWAKREGMIGFAGYPLLVDRRLVGVIAMFTRQPIPATIFEMMAPVAKEIAVGIERKVAEELARKHSHRIRALHDIEMAISSTLDLRAVLNVLLEKIEIFLPIATATTVRLLNDETGELESLACRGIEENEWRLLQRTAPGGRAKRVVETRAAVTARNIVDDRDTYNSDIFRKHGLVSYLGVPLIAKKKVLGVLSLYTNHEHEFSQEESEFLHTLAGQAAMAIHNAQLHEQTKKQHLALIEQERIQRILKELSQDITTMDVDALLEKLTSTIREVFKVDISDLRFLAGGKWANIIVASENMIQRLPEGAEFRRGATDWVVQNRKPIAIHDYPERKEFTPGRVTNKFGVRGFLAAPLMSKSGEVMGVIRALSKQPRTFTVGEIDLFEQLANGAAVAIVNERLYVDLEKSDKIKSEFLSVMSHELRTPLNIIMGYAALLKDDMVDDTDQDHRSSVVIIETQANELLTMVSSIMQATLIESGAITVHNHEVEVGQLMQKLRDLYDTPRDKNLALVWDYPQSLPTLVTDDVLLTDILRKLIDNAIRFTKDGSVTVSARLNGNFEFQVSDTGIGIPEESQPIIFDIFKQADGSSTREFGGAGLGLYIAKAFTELLGGSIEIESAVAQGSTFTVRMPHES